MRIRYPQSQSNSLISELWETIVQNPPAIPARIILMQHYTDIGWVSEAVGIAKDLVRVAPDCSEAQQLLSSQATDSEQQRGKITASTPPTPGPGVPKTKIERSNMEVKFTEDIAAVRFKSQNLLADMEAMYQQAMVDENDEDDIVIWEDQVTKLRAIIEGDIASVLDLGTPPSARAIAELMETQPDEAVDIAADDLIRVVDWLQKITPQVADSDEDTIRPVLLERVRMVAAVLSESLQSAPAAALMHVEHEKLGKVYTNNETMVSGEPIASIPRPQFWASQDNYAWDLEELVHCLRVNGAVMRNPLSREMFTVEDIQALIKHPLGKSLAAQRADQDDMAGGVRLATIVQLERLSSRLLSDQTPNQVPSRQALDEFGQHTAILPAAEQRALDELRVPATDSVSRQPFDCSIGEIVRDAIANRTCMHKAGDLVGQAARYLRARA